MRILVLNWKDQAHPQAGGAEVFTESVARCLVQRGHHVTLFSSAVSRKPSAETTPDGIWHVRRGGRHTVYREARLFYGNQPARSYDVVIDEINTRPFMAPRWVHDAPVVALIHQLAREVWFFETPLPVALLGRYFLEPFWLRTYRRTPSITVSASSARSLRRYHGWSDITIVPEGSSPPARAPVSRDPVPTIAFLGRLVGMKRPHHALRAFEIVRQALPESQLWIIGDGPMSDRLEGRSNTGVVFHGRVDERTRSELLARAHVLVTTSVREGWGLNVSEAAECGTPTIGYAVPGLVDSIPASGGHIVQPSPKALAQALLQYFSGDLRLIARPSTATWPIVTDAVEARLRNVVNRKNG